MVFEGVAKIIAESMGIEADTVTMEATFQDLGLDSLDVVDIMMKIEEEYSVTIEMSENIKCVGDVVAIVEAGK